MSKRKYLVLHRSQAGHPGRQAESGPSPEQMQQMFAAYKAWMEQFKDDIFDLGDKLKSDGRVVTSSGVADGPFVEVKELVGGFMIVSAESYDAAVAIVKACPANMPGVSLEIREMAGAKM
jgi:hypothetical protein